MIVTPPEISIQFPYTDLPEVVERLREAAAALRKAGSAIEAAGPVTEHDLLDAVQAPMPRPVITPVPPPPGRMGPQEALKALRAMTEKRAAPRPRQRWTAAQRALLEEIETNTDPALREAYRTALYKERGGT